MPELLYSLLLVIVPLCLMAWLLMHRRPVPATDSESLAGAIDRLLPQTQCSRCGYPGCLPYARAIAGGTAAINRCPPGGAITVTRIAGLLGREALPLKQPALTQHRQCAYIDENICIGCVKCIAACPVDAIIGAAKQIHTVIPGHCTGCELCIEPCPVDCISLIPAEPAVRRRSRDRLPGPDGRRV